MQHKLTDSPLGETGNVHKISCTCGDHVFYKENEPSKRLRVLELSRTHEQKGTKMTTGTSNWRRASNVRTK